MNSDADNAIKLCGLLRKCAIRLAQELTDAAEVHEKADNEGQFSVEIVALQAARKALDVLLVLADQTDDGRSRSKKVLQKLEDRLIGKTRGSPGLSLREQHLRWWVVEAVDVLVATKAMGRIEARKFACTLLKTHGIWRKRRDQGGHLQVITPDTIKGWEKTASSAERGRPDATSRQGRELADRILNHIIPALKDSEE